MVDVHGAVWTGRNAYELVASAKRYELYEMSFAAKVMLQPLSRIFGLMCTAHIFVYILYMTYISLPAPLLLHFLLPDEEQTALAIRT